jgi:hypothetical protein
MGIEYVRLTNFYDGVSSTMSEVPTLAWWVMGAGLVLLIFWTTKR